MKKGTGLLLIISTLILILLIIFVKSYRNLSTLNEEVLNKEADINVQLKIKKEQVKDIINLSKKYIPIEENIVNELEQNNDAFEEIEKYIVKEKNETNKKINTLLNELFSKYSDILLKDEEIKTRLDDIYSTEKRIVVASNNYNSAADDYNSKIKSFPSSIIAFFRGFKTRNNFDTTIKINNIIEEE